VTQQREPQQDEGSAHTQGTSATAPTRDGRALHYMELPGPPRLAGTGGAGVPTVVFDTGLAASRSYWALVQPLVGTWARSVAYDRAGLDDLLAYLAPGPFVLVAHSGGGMTSRVRAAANASHEHRAAHSPQGRHVVAERSGHKVVLTEPELIAAEVHRIVHHPGTADSNDHRPGPNAS
jgi:hypothetical protein